MLSNTAIKFDILHSKFIFKNTEYVKVIYYQETMKT